MKSLNNKKGFTLIELIVVIAIITIITSTASIALSKFLLTSQLNSYTNQIVQVLRKAQNRAFAGLYDADWAVTFHEDNSFSLLPLGQIELSEDYLLPKSLTIQNLETDQIVFSKFDGRINSNLAFSVIGQDNESYLIEINEVGKIEIK